MSEPSPYLYDLFISHARADLAWVDGYLLQNLGLPAERVITAQGFARGTSLVAEFEQAIQNSRLTLLVYSPAFPANEWTEFSEQLASHLSVETQRERVGLLLLQPCAIPLRLTPRLTFDCTDDANCDSEMARLRAFLRLPEPNPEDIPCPYPGMAPFRQVDAPRFFGRDDEIQELRRRLDEQSFILVTGPSGSGKSSLLSAGLIPTLSADWTCLTMRPGSQPLETLRSTLAGIGGADKYLAGGITPPDLADKHLLLIVDQLEELFVQTARSDQAAFIEAIRKLYRCSGWSVVLTLRADFYSDLLNSPLWPLKPEQRLEVVPLRGESLRPVIQRPANDLKVHLEAGLVETLIADAADEPGVLPLLQQTMVSLWKKRRRRLLPLHAYRAMGDGQRSGLATAVAAKADEALAQLTPKERLVAQRICLRLVAFGEGRLDTRRQQSLATLADVDHDRDRAMRVIQHLAQYRLLTLGDKDGEQQTVDIAHDVLITGWPALGDWLKQWRAAELTRRRLEVKVEEWERWARRKHPDSGLLNSAELAEAEQWLASEEASQLGYSPKLQALVDQSKAALKRSKRIRTAMIVALVTLVIGVLAAITIGQSQLATQRGQAAATAESLAQAESYARSTAESEVVVRTTAEAVAVSEAQARATAQANAEQERNIAVARQLTTESNGLIDQHLDLALLLSVEALRRDDSIGSRSGLLNSLAYEPRLVTYLHSPGGAVESVAVSSDSKTLAVGCSDGTITLWDIHDPESPRRLSQPLQTGGKAVLSLAFSPNGETLAAGMWDAIVVLWDIRDTAHPTKISPRLERHLTLVLSVAFSPDSRTLASGSLDTTTILWDVSDASRPYPLGDRLQGNWGIVRGVTFSPDGKTLAVGSGHTIVLWDVQDLMYPKMLGQPMLIADYFVYSVAFSPDGKMLAAGTGDPAIVLLDIQDMAHPVQIGQPLQGHTGAVSSIAFSRDGSRLASASGDHTIMVWNVSDYGHPQRIGTPFHIHTDSVTSIAYTLDGAMLFSGSTDGTVLLWDTLDMLHQDPVSPPLQGTRSSGNRIAFRPDGQTLASTSTDGNIHIWNLENKLAPQRVGQLLSDSMAAVLSIAFNPDGDLLASGSSDGTIALWNVHDLEHPERIGQPIKAHTNAALAINFSPDGRVLASGGLDGNIFLWDVQDRARVKQIGQSLAGGLRTVRSVVISPDGETLAAGGDEGIICLWDLQGMWETERLWRTGMIPMAHTYAVASMAFSPDGKTLASGSWDGTVKLWDMQNRIAPHQVGQSLENVSRVAFSPDGVIMATGSKENSIILWNASDVRNVRRFGLLLKSHSDHIETVAFSPDGSILASSSDDGTILLWDVGVDVWITRACRIANRNITQSEWKEYVGNDAYRATCPDLVID